MIILSHPVSVLAGREEHVPHSYLCATDYSRISAKHCEYVRQLSYSISTNNQRNPESVSASQPAQTSAQVKDISESNEPTSLNQNFQCIYVHNGRTFVTRGTFKQCE